VIRNFIYREASNTARSKDEDEEKEEEGEEATAKEVARAFCDVRGANVIDNIRR